MLRQALQFSIARLVDMLFRWLGDISQQVKSELADPGATHRAIAAIRHLFADRAQGCARTGTLCNYFEHSHEDQEEQRINSHGNESRYFQSRAIGYERRNHSREISTTPRIAHAIHMTWKTLFRRSAAASRVTCIVDA